MSGFHVFFFFGGGGGGDLGHRPTYLAGRGGGGLLILFRNLRLTYKSHMNSFAGTNNNLLHS